MNFNYVVDNNMGNWYMYLIIKQEMSLIRIIDKLWHSLSIDFLKEVWLLL